jgi:hypothetical protein
MRLPVGAGAWVARVFGRHVCANPGCVDPGDQEGRATAAVARGLPAASSPARGGPASCRSAPAIAALRFLQVGHEDVAEDAEAAQEIGMWPV